MRFALRAVLFIFITGAFFFSMKKAAFAAACQAEYPASIVTNAPLSLRVELPVPGSVTPDKIALCSNDAFGDVDANDPLGKFCFRIRACNTGVGGAGGCASNSWFIPGQQGATESISADGRFIQLNWTYDKSVTFKLEANDLTNRTTYDINASRFDACGNQWRVNVGTAAASCGAGTFTLKGKNGSTEDPLTLNYDGNKTANFFRGRYQLHLQAEGGAGLKQMLTSLSVGPVGESKLAWGSEGSSLTGTLPINRLPPGKYEFVVTGDVEGFNYCKVPFSVTDTDVTQQPTTDVVALPEFLLCDQTNPFDREKCRACVGESGESAGGNTRAPTKIWTALGCIPTSLDGIVTSLITIGLGLSGGVVILSVLAGAFMLATSSGNPKQVEEAQQLISAAVIGLLFVIFSVIILRFVGVNILRIPGFGL